MKKTIKIFTYTVLIIVILCMMLLLTCTQIISSYSHGRIFNDTALIPTQEVGLLLGTTPQTRIGRRPNQFFKFRIDAAEKLYKAGKIQKILISGDENSLDGVNEVESMRDSLVKRGVYASDIILDGKGFRTLDAVVRAVKVYDVHSFVVISQKFHNERAIYLAGHLELDAHDVIAFNAADATSNLAFMTYVREYVARVKVFIDILSKKQPKDMIPVDDREKELLKSMSQSEIENQKLLKKQTNERWKQFYMPSAYTKSLDSMQWKWHTTGSFKYPKSFHCTKVFVKDAPGTVEVISRGETKLCFWEQLGVWSTMSDFPTEGVWLSPTERVKKVTYIVESKRISSGYTDRGNIFFLKEKVYYGGEVDHGYVLVLIHPKGQEKEHTVLTNLVANW